MVIADKPQERPPPFRFEREIGKRFFIDSGNGLKLDLYQWPEFEFSLSVEPSFGAQAEAWPLQKRAYFEFRVAGDITDESAVLSIDAAFVMVPFDNDYPGRTGELLDVVVPMVCEVYAELLRSKARAYGPIPEQLRARLDRNKSYLRQYERFYRPLPKTSGPV